MGVSAQFGALSGHSTERSKMQLSAPLMESERINKSPGAGMTTVNDTLSGALLTPPEPAAKPQDTSACASDFTFNAGNQTVRNSVAPNHQVQSLTADSLVLSESMKIQKSNDMQTRAVIEDNMVSEVETNFP